MSPNSSDCLCVCVRPPKLELLTLVTLRSMILLVPTAFVIWILSMDRLFQWNLTNCGTELLQQMLSFLHDMFCLDFVISKFTTIQMMNHSGHFGPAWGRTKIVPTCEIKDVVWHKLLYLFLFPDPFCFFVYIVSEYEPMLNIHKLLYYARGKRKCHIDQTM